MHVDGILVQACDSSKPDALQRAKAHPRRTSIREIVDVDKDSAAWTFALKGANE